MLLLMGPGALLVDANRYLVDEVNEGGISADCYLSEASWPYGQICKMIAM